MGWFLLHTISLLRGPWHSRLRHIAVLGLVGMYVFNTFLGRYRSHKALQDFYAV